MCSRPASRAPPSWTGSPKRRHTPRDTSGCPRQSAPAATADTHASLLAYAADLKRPLLLVHGTADDNVYFRHTLKLSNALFREGKEFELLPLPGLTHMVPDPVVMERWDGRFGL